MAAPLVVGLTAIGALVAYNAQPAGTGAPVDLSALADLPPVPGLLVYVTGAVARPGLYRVNRGERLYAAIAAAGGLTGDADPFRLPNLAAVLRDGQQVKVPAVGGAGASSSRTAKLDLNIATEAQLAAVPGFTPALARAAINYRSSFGGFASTRELVTVLGMGEAEYARSKAFIRV